MDDVFSVARTITMSRASSRPPREKSNKSSQVKRGEIVKTYRGLYCTQYSFTEGT